MSRRGGYFETEGGDLEVYGEPEPECGCRRDRETGATIECENCENARGQAEEDAKGGLDFSGQPCVCFDEDCDAEHRCDTCGEVSIGFIAEDDGSKRHACDTHAQADNNGCADCERGYGPGARCRC